MDYINETLKTPVFGEYDVVVAGAGPAGVCAAIAAARNGAKALLMDTAGALLGSAYVVSGFYNPPVRL